MEVYAEDLEQSECRIFGERHQSAVLVLELFVIAWFSLVVCMRS